MNSVYHLEQPIEVGFFPQAFRTPIWWDDRPPSSTRRLRLVGVEMVEVKPESKPTGVGVSGNAEVYDAHEETLQQKSKIKAALRSARNNLLDENLHFEPDDESPAIDDDLSTLCASELQLESPYLRIQLLDTESNQPLFLRAQRTRLESMRSLNDVYRGTFSSRSTCFQAKDQLFPSDGILKSSEWISMTLNLSLPSSDTDANPATPKPYLADLALALTAVKHASALFAMVEPHVQQFWFCYLTMMVLGVYLKCEIEEHGLDDTRGKIKVCKSWDPRDADSRWKNWGEEECKPIWKEVKVEKVVQPSLCHAMGEVEREIRFDRYISNDRYLWDG